MSNWPPTIIYALATPSTSEEIVERVQSGEIEATLASIKAGKETS
jgi:hypothetical protein